MASVNAKLAAKEVSETIGNGGKINLGRILRKHGYSASTARSPRLVTETGSFKDGIAPVVQALRRELNAAIDRLGHTRQKASYRDLVDSVDKLTKNIQLLSGKETNRVSGSVVFLPSKRV